MVRVKPFRGLRPPPHMAAALSAPPQDVVDPDEAREFIKTVGETSFLRVNKPAVDLPPEVNQYDVQVRMIDSCLSVYWVLLRLDRLM